MTIVWVSTAPNPKSSATGFDAGQRGWKLHAVESKTGMFSDIRHTPAACGTIPSHGWCLDLFIEDKCKRCLEKHRGLK